eukprot:gnl/TRDRNA2_/TRDRNA2_86106_c0_seq1.p2 gnl/TRDRNA2_/TRDRNA2_86106_c0~~gnl/TRDRNA2_/TRDRNA2_86106_c0_seq1.p2  ORF type:complete len:263 (-),score=90.76 gnl/TRDRNA2_/TRDRNA2_86106_c0_seq1:189-935(-)
MVAAGKRPADGEAEGSADASAKKARADPQEPADFDLAKPGGKSKYVGVRPVGQRWQAMANGKSIGCYDTEVEAARARWRAMNDADGEEQAVEAASEAADDTTPKPASKAKAKAKAKPAAESSPPVEAKAKAKAKPAAESSPPVEANAKAKAKAKAKPQAESSPRKEGEVKAATVEQQSTMLDQFKLGAGTGTPPKTSKQVTTVQQSLGKGTTGPTTVSHEAQQGFLKALAGLDKMAFPSRKAGADGGS